MSSSPVYIPRSLQESPAYAPDWRHRQAQEYLRCRRRASESGEPFTVPLTERDPWVRSYYKFLSNLPTPRAAVFRYAQECHDSNDRVWMASRIKAMTVAGSSSAEIAGRLHTLPTNIEAFHKIYFDVSAYIHDRPALAALLMPMTEASAATDPRERVWLLAAMKMGLPGLERVMGERARFSPGEEREVSDAIHSVLAEQSLQYALTLQGQPEAGAKAMDAFFKSMDLRQRLPVKQDDGRETAFVDALIKATKADLARKEAARAAQGNHGAPIQAA